MKREDRIDKLMKSVEAELTDVDSFMVVFANGLTNEVSTGLLSNNTSMLISAICETFDMQTNDDKGVNFLDLFSSVIITYAKAHPKFATQFIQTFNRIMYGVDIDIC